MVNWFLGTSFADYSINNKFALDSKTFIAKKTGSAKFSFAFIYQNQTFGVWNDFKNGLVFVSNDFIHDTPYIFSTTLKDHTPNTMFINSAKKYSCWRLFIENYNLGNVRFENQKIKNIVQNLLKSIICR